jgi:Acetyltransferases, including N-acetylases of ribosomal proteins
VKILETERLILREITEDDAGFMLDLLNQPSFIKYIGDRGVRTVEQSRDFIENRYRKGYRDYGYGLYIVELKNDLLSSPPYEGGVDAASAGGVVLTEANMQVRMQPQTPIGICGFVRRETLPAPDIGFAFLPQYEKKGYAFESAEAVMQYGREKLNFERVLAITSLDNERSGKLLLRLGFALDEIIDTPEGEKLNLYSFNYSA